jgi:hypothetical protein
MKPMLVSMLFLSLACAGGPKGPAVHTADPAPPVEAVVRSPDETAAATWAAARWSVPEASVQTLPMSNRAGDPIIGVSREQNGAPTSVIVRQGEVFDGKEGVVRWKTAAKPDPTQLAVAVSLVGLGARSEPYGANPKRASQYPAPSLRPDGALDFWYPEPKRGTATHAIATFPADGSLQVTVDEE